MRIVLRILGAAAALVLLLAAGAAAFLWLKKPRMRPPAAEAVAATPERVARGAYLVEHVLDCWGCHSERDLTRFGGPVKPGTEGAGGLTWDAAMRFPGRLVASNITPDRATGLGAWSDGEVLRALREGVDRAGAPLFPIMPYPYYRDLADEDARAVVAYLRTVRPVARAHPPRVLPFPLNVVVKFVPEPVKGPVRAPAPGDRLAAGKYLVSVAACRECHTRHDGKGRIVAGRDFQGGWEMRYPGGRVVTGNLTPNRRVFMGQASKEQFIGRFKSYESLATVAAAPLAPRGRNTLMPWLAYAGMTPEDLGAIYDYLKTLPPGGDRVESFPDAAEPPPPPGAPAVVRTRG